MQLPDDFIESASWPGVLDNRETIQPNPAVYALVHENEFGRLNGQSSILYIGKTAQLGGNSDSCRLRIYRYPNGKHARELRRRTALLTDAGVVITLRWKYLPAEQDAASEETRLLTAYEEEHGELPPFNSKNERGL